MHSTESYTLCNLDSQTYSVHDHHLNNANVQSHHHVHPHQHQHHQQVAQQQHNVGHHQQQHYMDASSSHRLLHYPDRLATDYSLFGNNNDCFRSDWASSAASLYGNSHVGEPDVKRPGCYSDVLTGSIQPRGGCPPPYGQQQIDSQHCSNMAAAVSSSLRCPPNGGSTNGPFGYPSVAAGSSIVFDTTSHQQQTASSLLLSSASALGTGSTSCLQPSTCSSPLSASSSSLYGQFYAAATGGNVEHGSCGSGALPVLSRTAADYGGLSDSLLANGLASPSSGINHHGGGAAGQSVSAMAAAVAAVAPLFYPVNFGQDTSPNGGGGVGVGQHQMHPQTDIGGGFGFRPNGSSVLQPQQQCHQLQRSLSPSDGQQHAQQQQQQQHHAPGGGGHVTSQPAAATGTTGTAAATYKWMTVKRGAPKCSGLHCLRHRLFIVMQQCNL